MNKTKLQKRERRHRRVRAKVVGTAKRPRLSFHKSNTRIRVQLIDDQNGTTLVGITAKSEKGMPPVEHARNIGKELAGKAKEKKISAVVFDRGGFMYTGKVRAFAEGAREGGLKF